MHCLGTIHCLGTMRQCAIKFTLVEYIWLHIFTYCTYVETHPARRLQCRVHCLYEGFGKACLKWTCIGREMELEKNHCQQGSPIITVCTYKVFELASTNRHLRTVTLSSKVHCNENAIYVFTFGELRVPVFPIHIWEQFIYSLDRSTYFLQQNRQIDRGNI